MLSKAWRKTVWLVIVGMFFFIFAFGQSEGSEPRLDKTDFAAQGMNETLLHVDVPGRYSLQAKSDQGTELELVDRMAGPFAISGKAGEQDGRLDILLDKGTYKVRLKSHAEGKGSLKLAVYPFQEVQKLDKNGDFPLLNLHQMEIASLEDLQQCSFWIYLKRRQILRLEAIGRNLKDCRLWHDGNWLVDITPSLYTYETMNGQPMTYAEFHHDMNPGLYLLTCYGGEALAWTNDSGEHPFSLRMGIPELGINGKQIVTISTFGRDTFLLPQETNFFQLLREDKKDTALLIGTWSNMGRRHASGLSAYITKESRNPWCIIQWRRHNQKKWVTVKGKPGDRVVLEYFVHNAERYTFYSEHKEWWISSQHSAEGRDAVDVTAILTHRYEGMPVASQVLKVGNKNPLVRKINLLGENTVFLKVENEGTYVIWEDKNVGAKGRYKIEPFMVSKPRNYQSPPFQLPGRYVELIKGFYTLTMQPESKGILSFVLYKKGEDISDLIDDDVFSVEQSVLWPKVNFPRQRENYTVWLNKRHDVASGLIVRPLPLDLNEPLPVTLKSGETVPVHIIVKRESKLVIERDKETPFNLKEGRHNLSSGSLLSTGEYVLKLQNTGEETTLFTLKTIPHQETQSSTFQDISARLRKREQQFPILTAKKPLYVDFARGEKKHFTLLVEQPGLYRLETGGRMATGLTVRTPIITSLFTASQNGIGRNALVQQYLKPGEYQITVQTQGKSKGRAGIHLHRTSLIEQNGPEVDGMKKQTLEPNAAVRYSFVIDKAGRYHLQTVGLGKQFAHRLEDEAEWPLLRPGGKEEIVRHFEPGVYHYYSLPEPIESKRIISLKTVIEKQELQGKGPHQLLFNETIRHVWREEANRPADIFTTEITALVEVIVHLAQEMEAVIHKSGEGDVGKITGGKAWQGKLSPGSYKIKVKSIEENDLFPYTLRMETSQLIPGLRQRVNLPATLEISLGEEGLVDIYSFGATDVKASLWDEKGDKLLARNDDIADDWNFLISQKLEVGSYLLRLVAVGTVYGPIEVAMREREERSLPEQSFPFTIEENLEQEVLRIPFKTGEENNVVWIKATSNDTLGLALFREENVLAEGKEQFYLPLKANTSYSLLLWRLGESMGKVTLKVTNLHLEQMPLSLEETVLSTPTMQTIAIELINANKISYSLKGDVSSFLFSPALEQPFQTVRDVPVVMSNGHGWLVARGSETIKNIIVKPFALEVGTVEVVELGQVPLPFDFEQTADGPLLLEVESVGSIVGAMAYTHGKQVEDEFHWSGMWMEKSNTILAVPGKGKYRGKIWQTSQTVQTERVRLKLYTFKTDGQVNFGEANAYEGTLQSGMAKTIVLNNMSQSLELLLTNGLVAFVWYKDRADAIVAARNGHVQQTVIVSGGLLTILNNGKEESLFRVERKGKPVAVIQTFDRTSGFEHVFAKGGVLHLSISGVGAGKRLFVAGDKVSSRFLGSDGYISEDESYLIPDQPKQGILELSYDPGYVKVWQAEAKNKDLAFMGKIPSKGGILPFGRGRDAKKLQNGIGTLEDKAQLWEFALEHLSYIDVNADAPGATALLEKEKILAISVGSDSKGRRLVYSLPAGNYQLWTRPLKNLSQEGKIRLHKVRPHPLNGEAEKIWLIRPSETQIFAFHVVAKGKVGVGVRTESDQLEAKVFDSQFDMLAEAPLMIRELEPGDYLLTVETSNMTSLPVQYSPVVFGNEGSEQGIPEEVIREYITQKAAIE